MAGERRLSGPTKNAEHQQNVPMETERCTDKNGTVIIKIIKVQLTINYYFKTDFTERAIHKCIACGEQQRTDI